MADTLEDQSHKGTVSKYRYQSAKTKDNTQLKALPHDQTV